MWTRLRLRVAALVRRTRFERDLADELAFHVQTRAEEWERRGLSPPAARRRARTELGSAERIEEEVRDVRLGGWLEVLRQDLHYGFRGLRAHRGITAIGRGGRRSAHVPSPCVAARRRALLRNARRPIVRGRTFTEHDFAGGGAEDAREAETPVVINQTAERRVFAAGSAVGSCLWADDDGRSFVVVGVVPDVRPGLLNMTSNTPVATAFAPISVARLGSASIHGLTVLVRGMSEHSTMSEALPARL